MGSLFTMVSSNWYIIITVLCLVPLQVVQTFEGGIGQTTSKNGWPRILGHSKLSSTKAFSCHSKTIHSMTCGDLDHQATTTYNVNPGSWDRRDLLKALPTTMATAFLSPLLYQNPSNADDAPAVDPSQILLRLKSIPTFCIVDPNGVPFMIFDGQASATGYFFLSFDIAAQALGDAKRKDTNVGATAIWDEARIIVVPLAVALQLSLRKSQRVAVNNGIRFNTYGDIVPSQEGVDDAKALDASPVVSSLSNKWEQKGRVPLFFIPDLKLENGRQPRYFNQKDLLKEWYRQHSNQSTTPPPKIQIVEMVDLYRSSLMGKNLDLDLIENIVIMPVVESNQVASQLLQRQPKDDPLPKYDYNKVYLVGSAQG